MKERVHEDEADNVAGGGGVVDPGAVGQALDPTVKKKIIPFELRQMSIDIARKERLWILHFDKPDPKKINSLTSRSGLANCLQRLFNHEYYL